ncbi:hypothetical protein AURDEDRAFT_176239 [Auricularia subglabra TFB-10046 SS5]|nr:hypothetical protein AURDEDRAFT_176239 [Auricularia subglabra TFB-10046 SS5]
MDDERNKHDLRKAKDTYGSLVSGSVRRVICRFRTDECDNLDDNTQRDSDIEPLAIFPDTLGTARSWVSRE